MFAGAKFLTAFAVSFIGLGTVTAQANPLGYVQDYMIPQPFVAPRALGMGNTFSGLTDYNVLFYRPSGLASLTEANLNLMIQVGGSPAAVNLMNNITSATANTTDPTQLANLMQNQYGHAYGASATVGGIWAWHNWGFAFLPLNFNLDAVFHQLVGPAAAVTAYQDSTVALGYGHAFGDGRWKAGGTVKAIYRAFYGNDIVAADLLSNTSFFRTTDASEGLTADLDISTEYEFEVPKQGILSIFSVAKPTLAIAGRNLTDYGFGSNLKLYNKAGTATTPPPTLQRRMDVGIKWELPSFWKFSPLLMTEMRDIGAQYFTTRKGLHLGFDLPWEVSSWLKGNYSIGLSQSYWTAGVGLELGIFRLDAVSYSEEVQTDSAPLENRLYVAKLSLIF